MTSSRLLKDRYPEVYSQLHPAKNESVDVSKLTYGSGKKVWWKCDKGHEWEQPIFRRTNSINPIRCRHCNHRGVLKSNSLQTNDKLGIVKEWHSSKNLPLTPLNITPHSNKKVWWKCVEGHEWLCSVSNRVKKRKNNPKETYKSACPYCINQKTSISKSLSVTNPDLLDEWHPIKNLPLTPNKVTQGSQRKVWWKCKRNHEWCCVIRNRAKLGQGCRKCYFIECHFTKKYPQLLDEYHPSNSKSPQEIKSNEVVLWRCKKGHEWSTTPSRRINHKQVRIRKCPYCINYKVCNDNCLFNNDNYGLLDEWNYFRNKDISPKDVTPFSSKVVWWQCEKGHEWKSSLCRRILIDKKNIKRKSICPYCCSVRVCKDNSLACHTEFYILQGWHYSKNHPVTSKGVTGCSNKKVWWQCEKGHEWNVKIYNVSSGNVWCPVCCESRGERAVRLFLESNRLLFEPQKTFKDCFHINRLRFDFYVISPIKNFVIEYDGPQHFMPISHYGGKDTYLKTVKRDIIKNSYCRRTKIPILRIQYTQFSEINSIIQKFIDKL